jgi:hypothetical protein
LLHLFSYSSIIHPLKKVSRRSFIPSLGALLTFPAFSSMTTKTSENKTTLNPKAIKKGATIGFCAPAG